MSIRHVESMNSQMAYYSSQLDQSLESGNFEEAFALSIGHSILQNRNSDRARHDEYLNLRDDRQKKVNEYAMTFQGFGMNNNTGMTAVHALASFHQGAGMAFGAVKSLKEEGVTNGRTLLQHATEELKRVQDDLKSDSQRSQSSTAEAINMLKQLNSLIHDAKSQMARGT